MVLITIVTGAYKPTYNWGASHCNQWTILLTWMIWEYCLLLETSMVKLAFLYL